MPFDNTRSDTDEGVAALDATIDAALAILGARADRARIRAPIEPESTIGHHWPTLTADAASTPSGDTDDTSVSRPGDVIRSLGPASMSVGTLPGLSVSRATSADAGGSGAGEADLRIISLLGEGGMGRVELAHQRSLRREVAVKSLRRSDSASAAGLNAATSDS